jgi:multisubunit Na+/H+ antiporter MnhB subunit
MNSWVTHLVSGLMIFACSLYVFLMAYGVVPKSPENPELMKKWRQRMGPLVKVLAVFLMIVGLMMATGLMDRFTRFLDGR